MSQTKCPICGAPTFVYFNARKDGLCAKHADMLKAGEIEQCEKCGKYHKRGERCACTIPKRIPVSDEKRYDACIVCGQPSNGYPQCRDCYYETQDFIHEYDKNKRIDQICDHYYNLKDKIFRMRDVQIIQTNCNRLWAIARLASELHHNDSLVDKVISDITGIVERSRKQTVIESETRREEIKEKDRQRTEIIRADDGHYVESDIEAEIDNVLYNANILHCYGQNIIEILEARKKCDWFIPIRGTTGGIYIEYWGMKTPEYLKSREEKEKLYKKYDIPYIGIEKDEPKGDKQGFKTNLIQRIHRLATERYGFMPQWIDPQKRR